MSSVNHNRTGRNVGGANAPQSTDNVANDNLSVSENQPETRTRNSSTSDISQALNDRILQEFSAFERAPRTADTDGGNPFRNNTNPFRSNTNPFLNNTPDRREVSGNSNPGAGANTINTPGEFDTLFNEMTAFARERNHSRENVEDEMTAFARERNHSRENVEDEMTAFARERYYGTSNSDSDSGSDISDVSRRGYSDSDSGSDISDVSRRGYDKDRYSGYSFSDISDMDSVTGTVRENSIRYLGGFDRLLGDGLPAQSDDASSELSFHSSEYNSSDYSSDYSDSTDSDLYIVDDNGVKKYHAVTADQRIRLAKRSLDKARSDIKRAFLSLPRKMERSRIRDRDRFNKFKSKVKFFFKDLALRIKYGKNPVPNSDMPPLKVLDIRYKQARDKIKSDLSEVINDIKLKEKIIKEEHKARIKELNQSKKLANKRSDQEAKNQINMEIKAANESYNKGKIRLERQRKNVHQESKELNKSVENKYNTYRNAIKLEGKTKEKTEKVVGKLSSQLSKIDMLNPNELMIVSAASSFANEVLNSSSVTEGEANEAVDQAYREVVTEDLTVGRDDV